MVEIVQADSHVEDGSDRCSGNTTYVQARQEMLQRWNLMKESLRVEAISRA